MTDEPELRPKPKYGQECNRCGVCCIVSLCPLGEVMFDRRKGPCPALFLDDKTKESGCGLLAFPQLFFPELCERNGVKAMQRAARQLVGAGHGCDMPDPGERPDPSFRRRLIDRATRTANYTVKAMALWGVEVNPVAAMAKRAIGR